MNKIDIFKNCLQDFGYNINNIVSKEICKVTMNSKEVEKDTLFFAINNGNKYVDEAISLGGIVITDDKQHIDTKEKNVVYVKDTITFMQYFANKWRNVLSTTIIAVTGSNGKTSVKDILATLLKEGDNVLKTYKNYNNHIGVPFTLLQLEHKHQYGIIELGTSSNGEIEFLSRMVEPDYSLITNIGHSHLEYFKTQENIYAEKISVIKYTRNKTVVNIRDKWLNLLYGEQNIIMVNDGLNFYSDLEIINENMLFSLHINNELATVSTNILGEHNALNILLAITLVKKLTQKPLKELAEKLVHIELSEMRMQIIKIEEATIINDAYNSSPNSLKVSLETFDQMYKRKSKIAVIGSMLELGEKTKQYHEEVVYYILKTNIELVILYGEETKYIEKYIVENNIPIKVIYIEVTDQFVKDLYKISDEKNVWMLGDRDITSLKEEASHRIIAKYLSQAIRDIPDVKILLKGSRGVHLEKILNILKEN